MLAVSQMLVKRDISGLPAVEHDTAQKAREIVVSGLCWTIVQAGSCELCVREEEARQHGSRALQDKIYGAWGAYIIRTGDIVWPGPGFNRLVLTCETLPHNMIFALESGKSCRCGEH